VEEDDFLVGFDMPFRFLTRRQRYAMIESNHTDIDVNAIRKSATKSIFET